MKLGIVSDIHCNTDGLRRALDALREADEILCLGDSIDGYRFSNDVVTLLRDSGAHMILGNHEETFLAHNGNNARPGHEADPALLSWLASHPTRRERRYGDKTLLMVHSTPWEPRGDYIYPHSEQLERFAETGADFVLYGHTHAPVARRHGGTLIINPGSTGQPRYTPDGWQLGCALLDTRTGDAHLIGLPVPEGPRSA